MKNRLNYTYAEMRLKKLKLAKTDKEKEQIINKIYEEGFEDGYNEKKA